ncbi:receptor-like cytosolic serine/threonine-protein kinase RBK2 isoform X2 [Durio zibethinus]|uniref:non-specific serine/threonine protein kinase n=1 Tax=Durio zibethinus TaxID=66656 RepID=A0A6P5WUY1_DURZI|nr:receptor-like cytosolic serine/threonine-protein kinase RBK2 isoform X2 [Durio zibethinus]
MQSENCTDSDNRPGKNSEDVVIQARHKRQGAIFSSYSSAHELCGLNTEKEKKDGSSPKGVIEACLGLGLESNMTSPDESPKAEIRCTHSGAFSNWRKFFKLWKRRPGKHLASFPPLTVPKLSRKSSRSTKENPVLRDLYNFKSSLKNFSLRQLQAATNNFNPENIIGKGGYAEVYKGCLEDGKLLAIKRLTKGTLDERTAGFLSELGVIAHVNHPNTAKLIGCGIEGGMHLVFALSTLGSLGSVLHGSRGTLNWSKRYKIALGIADGLTYLHETCERRIIHRDIKSDNILLTENFEPQICDFGLAKWLPRQWTHYNVSKFEGTFGYFAPEYFMHGIVDEKTDVYAFGVLLLELITGRKALDDQQQSVVIWAKPLLDENDIKDLVDPSLGDDYDEEEVDRMVLTASLCIEQSPILRPQMSQVVILLRGDEYVADCFKESQRRSIQRTYSNELLDAHEYNSTKHLSNINRLQEIALGS